MPTLPSSYNQILQEFNSLVYNPSQRFFTAGDILNFINRGVGETANAIGGIRVNDLSNISGAGQQDYVIDNAIRQIIGVWYITNIGLPNEKRVPIDVITFKDQDFLSRTGWHGAEYGLNIPTEPEPCPRFAIFMPTTNTLRLLPPTLNAGDTIWLDCMEIPNILATGVVYNGDTMETGAIVYKAVSLARLKSRETQESQVFDTKWQQAVMDIRKMRSKMRRRRQVGDGRFEITRLRSVNGAV